MSNIQKHLNDIISASLGKDVRQAIHDGIQECYKDGKAGAIDLEARQEINALDETKADKTELAAQFTFKGSCLFAELPASGAATNDTWYVTDKKCNYSWNGEAWFQSSISETEYEGELADISTQVTEVKSDLSEMADSYIPFVNIVKNSYPNSNGEFETYANWDRTDFIKIPDFAKELVVSNPTNKTTDNAFYDSNKNFISKFSLPNSSEKVIVEIPSTAKYFVISNSTTFLKGMKVFSFQEGAISGLCEDADTLQKVVNSGEIPFGVIANSYVNESGSILSYDGWSRTDFVELIDENELCIYTSVAKAGNVFYDKDKKAISNFRPSVGYSKVSVPVGAKYVIMSAETEELAKTKIFTSFKYHTLLEQEETQDLQKFRVKYSSVYVNDENGEFDSLSLFGVHKNNKYYSEKPNGRIPHDDGYLYIDEYTGKMYYSEYVHDNPQYICDWDSSIADDVVGNYCCIITDDKDFIFVVNSKRVNGRHNPIIYPHGDYTNPYVIDFGNMTKPAGMSDMFIYDLSTNNEFFVFGEYRKWGDTTSGELMYIWKVTKPYNNPNNWKKVSSWYHTDYQTPVGKHPNNEIGHFHTIDFDFYSGAWLASTGDVDHQCRILMSTDNAETWNDLNLGGGQRVRLVGFVFTKDYVYYQTDTTDANARLLFRCGRDATTNYPDFSTLEVVTETSKNGQAGYCTIYMHNPNGLLLIDRFETPEKAGSPVELYFYSFEDEKLHKVDTLYPLENYQKLDEVGRYGLPYTTITRYQNPNTDGIVCGTTSMYKGCNVKVLNNDVNRPLRNIKISIY